MLEIDGIEEDNEAIKNLDDARMSMMNFMKDFGNEFSFDKYPMDTEKPMTILMEIDSIAG